MKATKIALSTAGLLLATGLGVLGGRALATGAPVQTPLTYAGTVTDAAGKPYPTAQSVKVSFYDKADATVAKCTSPQAQTEANTGHFSVVLPPECAQAVHEAPDLWTEATVGESKTVLPRTHVGAVPYALEADAAKVAAGAGGALKTTLDGLASDVAGLKAGSGGGGPILVDGKGVTIGKMLGVTSANPLTWRIQSAPGYLIDVGEYDPWYGSASNVWFTESNCKGSASWKLPDGAAVDNRLISFGPASTIYVPNGPILGKSIAGKLPAVLSYGNPGKCASAPNSSHTGVPVHPASLADLGLPAKLTPPLTIQP